MTSTPIAHIFQLRVFLPERDGWLTANRSLHHMARSARVADWREATVTACHRAGLPRGITPVTITAVIAYRGRRPVRDTANLAPTMKAVIDGLTPARTVKVGKGINTRVRAYRGYGFLPDDSDRHLLTTPIWVLREVTEADRLGPLADGFVDLTITHHPTEVPHG